MVDGGCERRIFLLGENNRTRQKKGASTTYIEILTEGYSVLRTVHTGSGPSLFERLIKCYLDPTDDKENHTE